MLPVAQKASNGWIEQASLIVTGCYLSLHEGLEMPQMVGLDRKDWVTDVTRTSQRPWDAWISWLRQESLIVTVVTWDSTKTLRCLNWLVWTEKLESHWCYLGLTRALRCLNWLAWTGKLDSHRCYLRLHEGLEVPHMVALDRKAWQSQLLTETLRRPGDSSNGLLGQESLIVTVVTWDFTKALTCLQWLA